MDDKKRSPSLNFFRPRKDPEGCRRERLDDGWVEVRCGEREWEELYRRRWQHDKVVRSTHGVNCTGSCSWKVYVKDGIIAWETQEVDYPSNGPDLPEYEPRGCPRGATYSSYIYSPLRVKYPYIRSALYEMWAAALRSRPDPVAAWASIVEDPEKSREYKAARGQGGLVRFSWDEAATLISASLIYTIRKFGPDRIFGFTPIPAMSMVAYSSGTRFLSLLGAPILSFYDWYCDLPPASPQIWGEQTDVPESADWYNSGYVIVWGTNLPMTRSPDAHFFVESRYAGTKVAAVAPDFAEYTKFADTWLPARAGTDGALALAMTFVVLKEFYLDRKVEYFTQYARQFTDLPFAVMLKPSSDHANHYVSDRFFRASDLGRRTENGEWKPVLFDRRTGDFAVPRGTIGARWQENGRWNLHLKDEESGAELDPPLTFEANGDGWVAVDFPYFEARSGNVRTGFVPAKKLVLDGKEILVTTVFDLLAAHLGIDRGHGGDAARDYEDPRPYTPAWQEGITGVPRGDAIRVAREFAENAEKTRGKSRIFLGSGTNHWYHSDTLYRCILNLTSALRLQGVNGGGWAHYTGQEKIRPVGAWTTLAFAQDWVRPPRQQNGTSFFYFATGQWRYDHLSAAHFLSPLNRQADPRHMADYNVIAARLGWLPSYPQFDRNPLQICREAEERGAKSAEEIAAYAADQLKRGTMRFAVEDPDHPRNFPRVLFLWRGNLLGASSKGHEYFLKHLLGVPNAVLQDPVKGPVPPREVVVRDPAPEGKLDLLVTSDFRMSTSAVYADVLLPAASWYEMHDLSTTDMHPFIHPFNPAVDPLWESRDMWDSFKIIAEKFSELAARHLGRRKDLVAVPLLHDTEAEISQPMGRVLDWKKGDTAAVAGKTLPRLSVVERDYPNVHKMMTALGPLAEKGQIGAKGVLWNAAESYADLRERVGTVGVPGVSQGMPRLETSRQVCEAFLALAPETDGRIAVKAWNALGKKTGMDLSHLVANRAGEKITFADLDSRPHRVLPSPTWSGLESEGRRYSPFAVNVEEKVPFRTLTGRAHFYLDHEWMLDFGEALPIYRPPLDPETLGSQRMNREAGEPGTELVLNYLTPHSKWSIHTTYSDTLIMLTLFRGGPTIWINHEDAGSVGIGDNEWLECFNINGVVMAKAVISHRIPRGKAFMYHAQERMMSVPGSSITGLRGGTHNSVTRILLKPTQMIGGYAQLSYAFNYYGPTGAQRDEIVVVRRAGKVDWYED